MVSVRTAVSQARRPESSTAILLPPWQSWLFQRQRRSHVDNGQSWLEACVFYLMTLQLLPKRFCLYRWTRVARISTVEFFMCTTRASERGSFPTPSQSSPQAPKASASIQAATKTRDRNAKLPQRGLLCGALAFSKEIY